MVAAMNRSIATVIGGSTNSTPLAIRCVPLERIWFPTSASAKRDRLGIDAPFVDARSAAPGHGAAEGPRVYPRPWLLRYPCRLSRGPTNDRCRSENLFEGSAGRGAAAPSRRATLGRDRGGGAPPHRKERCRGRAQVARAGAGAKEALGPAPSDGAPEPGPRRAGPRARRAGGARRQAGRGGRPGGRAGAPSPLPRARAHAHGGPLPPLPPQPPPPRRTAYRVAPDSPREPPRRSPSAPRPGPAPRARAGPS